MSNYKIYIVVTGLVLLGVLEAFYLRVDKGTANLLYIGLSFGLGFGGLLWLIFVKRSQLWWDYRWVPTLFALPIPVALGRGLFMLFFH